MNLLRYFFHSIDQWGNVVRALATSRLIRCNSVAVSPYRVEFSPRACHVLSEQAGTGPLKSAPYLRLKNSKRTSKCRSSGEFGTFYEKILKRSHNAKKTESGDPLGFFNIHSVATLSKIEGGPFGGKKFPKKSRTVPKKNLKGGPFGLVRYCMLRGKPFWFSSLGQQVNFEIL